MKSTAATVEQYLASLPEDRRATISSVRRFILENLDKYFGADFQECMQYGVIGYCVPHNIWPQGHHTNPKLPLMYMGLSSQKNDMVVYMLFLLHNKPEREWFDAAWKATGRKNHLEVSGAGCCLRFKKADDLAFDVIGKAIRRNPSKKYLEDHVAILARLGKGPDGKALKGGKKDGSRTVARKVAGRSGSKPATAAKRKPPRPPK